MIEVILCDDHALIRRGIRNTLAEAVDIRVVGEAGEYGELRSLMRATDRKSTRLNSSHLDLSRMPSSA